MSVHSLSSTLMAMVAIFFIATGSVFVNADTNTTCQKDLLEKMDVFMKDMEMVPNSKRRFPETFRELRESCDINKKMMGMITNMADKCMTGFTKNVVQVTIYSMRKQNRALCRKKPNKEINELLDAGKCINAGRKVFHKCLMNAQNHILAVKQMPPKQRIPLVCCEMIRAKNCMLEKSQSVSQCTDKRVDVIQNRYATMSGNTMNMACGDFNEDTDRCDQIHAPPLDRNEKHPQSFMMIALDLMEAFEHDADLL